MCGEARPTGKAAGEDKKLYKSLENKFSEDLDDYQDGGLSIVSPFGPLTQNASRKTLYYLISTLNSSFPDYDFRWAPNSAVSAGLVDRFGRA